MWKYILIALAILIVGGVAFFLIRKNAKNSLDDAVSASSTLSGTDAEDYLDMSSTLKQYMNCAEDGGSGSRCAPNWRDGGKTRDTIGSDTIARYGKQLAETEYSNDNIRKVAGRNLIYHWRYQLNAKNKGRTVSNSVYEALFDDVQRGVL